MTKKSVSKRLRITRNGKVVRRQMGANHFRTRKSTKNIRNNSKEVSLGYPMNKIVAYSLNTNQK